MNGCPVASRSPLRLWVLLWAAPIVVVSLIGCGGKTQDARQKQTSHLRTLISLYNAAGKTFGRAPASEEQFREYVAANGQPVLEKLEIASVDELLKSERDGQPFVVLYGKKPKGVRHDVVAYEQTGVDGKRQVGLSLGIIEEVDEAKFAEYVPPGAVAN